MGREGFLKGTNYKSKSSRLILKLANKRKIRQKGLYQTKIFLHSKGNSPQSETTAYRMKKNLQTIHVLGG